MPTAFYINPETVRTSVRQTIRYHLKQITRENGYETTIGDVFNDIPATKSDIVNWPGVTVIYGRETYVHDNQDQWFKTLPVQLLCWLQDGEDMTLARERLLGDIETKFGQNDGGWQLVGEDGQYRVQMAGFDWNEPFGIRANLPTAGIAIQMRVTYYQRIADASATGETE